MTDTLIRECFNEIEEISNASNHPQLVHASNIIKKSKSEKGERLKAIENLADKYIHYLRANLHLQGYSREIINQRVELLNQYYDYYDQPVVSGFDYNKLFTSQGKLRPTILEEFMYLLFKDYLADIRNREQVTDNKLGIGNAKAYTNLFFSPGSLHDFLGDPSVKINEKNQDFAIYRTIPIDFCEDEQTHLDAKVPILAVEVKTYIDKTMLEGIIATAEKLKMGNPYSRFIVVSESYQVDRSVDSSYSQIDQIYIIRKCGAMRRMDSRPQIYADVVWRMFEEAKKHIEDTWSDVQTKLERDGVIY